MATATVLPFSPELMDALRSEDIDIGLPQTKASDQLSSSVGTTTISSSSTIGLPSSTKRGADTLVSFDPASLRARYDAERDKRLAANPTGLDQYISVDDQDSFFRKYLDDPYIRERIVRDAIEEETGVVIIGGGFGGQLAAVRLIEHGISDIRIIEKGGDFGGTWYWNRYPGAQCDIESYVYMPLLHETGYVPTEKYARCDELLRHAQTLGRHYGLYDKAHFQTEVKKLVWDETRTQWVVNTDRGDVFRAQFVISASGPLHRPKIPSLKGLQDFRGTSFHTTRWDYNYTGGDHRGNLHKLANKRVGIIGTGATSVQVVPQLGKWAKELFVFQRTPSSVDVRGNRPTDPDWVKSLGDDWQKTRRDNFNIIVNGGHQSVDLVADGWTDIFRRLAPQRIEGSDGSVDLAEVARKRQMYDFEKMEQIRVRVDSIVHDASTAEKLKPYYNQFCKRPCFHDEYLQTFNRPNVTLVDTDGKGVQSITEKGVIANGEEYELDCLIYATGFDLVGEWTHRNGYDLIGEGERTLSEKWQSGLSTLHGWTTRGFPNCCFVSVAQAAFTPNVIHVTDEQVSHFAYVISEARRRGVRTFQPTQAAEDSWVETILELAKLKDEFHRECTPGYYNNEGKPSAAAARNANYGAGPLEFFELMAQWRLKGDLAGLELRY